MSMLITCCLTEFLPSKSCVRKLAKDKAFELDSQKGTLETSKGKSEVSYDSCMCVFTV